jgi:predicted signal transduction protein with EAL and GGDEF domain/DNA-binding CsgD family transcriptional regulator
MEVRMAQRGRPKPPLILTDEERPTLERLTNRRKTAQGLALRARIILACAGSKLNKEVAAQLKVSPATVGKWRNRFLEDRLDGLFDEPRPGPARTITDRQIGDVIIKTLEDKPLDTHHRDQGRELPAPRRQGSNPTSQANSRSLSQPACGPRSNHQLTSRPKCSRFRPARALLFSIRISHQVLVEIGKRFCTVVRPDDTVARLGGDEFVVLSDGLPNEAQVMRYAQRILSTLVPPMHVDGHEVRVGASVGIAIDGNVLEPEVFFRDADAAMYHAKENGRGRIEIFDTKMRNLAITRVETEDRLHRAVEQGLIRLHYQPIVEIGSQRVVGAEALARWNDPKIGAIPPTVFVPIAEDNGLIVPLGAQILAFACSAAARWPSTLDVSVNLSGCQIRDPGLVDTIETALSEANLNPDRLLLEITESIFMKDVTASTDVLRRLRDLGVRLAIDGFGTGYSSLARLKLFPIAQLKIDRSFVDGLPDNENDLAIVTAVITMGQSLGFNVLAEGIETEAQLSALQSLGCDLGQGFFFSHALPEAEFTGWLHERDFRATSSPATESASLRLVVG